MAEGTLIAESLRIGAVLDALPLEVTEIRRQAFDGLPAAQPPVWTFIRFSVADARVDELATALAAVLDDVGGWYCDVHTATDTVVVFAQEAFRYPRGDPAGRERAAAHARRLGVPENQIDWPE